MIQIFVDYINHEITYDEMCKMAMKKNFTYIDFEQTITQPYAMLDDCIKFIFEKTDKIKDYWVCFCWNIMIIMCNEQSLLRIYDIL